MAIGMLNDPDGFQRSAEQLEKTFAHAIGGDSPVVIAAALELERSIKLELSMPGTGRTYKKGKHVHIASAPGHPPAVDTGILRETIGHETVGGVMRVGSPLEKAPGLEFGTVEEGGFIAPRPFMRPALEKVTDKMTDAVVVQLRRQTPGA